MPFIAHLTDGTKIIESDSAGFVDVQAAEKSGRLRAFEYQLPGFTMGVDLLTGAFRVGEELYDIAHPGAPLRVIYYRTMQVSMNGIAGSPELACVTVGWQTTVEGKNVRLGVKAYPAEGRWHVTEDI